MSGFRVSAHTGALVLILFAAVRCSDSKEPGTDVPEREGGAGGSHASGGAAGSGGGRSGGATSSGGHEASGGASGEAPPVEAGSPIDAGGGDAGPVITDCQKEVFASAPRFALPEPPIAATNADVDGDGDQDIVTLRRGSDSELFESWVRVLVNAGDGTFEPGERFAVESSARVLAAGDLDGDGKPDVVVGHGEVEGVPESVNVVSVLLNDGNGGFGAATSYAAGTAHRSVSLGDVDGDAHADIVVTNHGSGEIRILANHGDGTFEGGVPLTVAPFPDAAALADLDGDGKLDIAVTDRAAAARVLLNQGNGTFAAPVVYGGPPDATLATVHDGITATDFNGDGKVDLLVARNARVLLAQGNGTFSAPVVLAQAPGGDGFAGDFDGDGKVDVALGSAEGVAVRFGGGDGTFSPAAYRAYALSTSVPPIAADFDGDGDLDVAGADLTAEELAPSAEFPDAGRQDTVVSGTLTLLRNTGSGVFEGERNYVVKTGAPHRTVEAADLNGDGRADVVTTATPTGNAAGTGFVAYALNEGAGVFGEPAFLPSGGVAPSSLALGDLDADGHLDVIVCNAGSDAVESNVGVLLAAPAGGFAPVKALAGVPRVTRAFYGQFDAQPAPDILVSGELDTYLLSGEGGGDFRAATRVDVPSVVHVADFDGDGFTDLVAMIGTWAVHVRINRGDGTYEDPISLAVFWRPTFRTFAVSSADFDGNGKPDVLISSGLGDVLTDPSSTGTIFEDAQVSVFPSLGDRTFGEPFVSTPTLPRNSRPTGVASGDFDGDGHRDVIVGAGTSAAPGTAPGAYVLINRGDNTFFEPVPWGTRNETSALVTARLNEDGADDVAMASASSVAVFLTKPCSE